MTCESCFVVVLTRGKPKVKRGRYDASEYFGYYSKHPFGIPEGMKSVPASIDNPTSKPVFVVNSESQLALPVGVSVVEDKFLGSRLEVVFNKKYAKALVMRVFDVVQTLLVMGAGFGLCLFALILLSSLTGEPIVFGSA